MSSASPVPFPTPEGQADVPVGSYEPHHRDLRGGALRAAVFGMSDGLVSNVSLVLGMAGGSASSGVVRLAGMAGLVAGAFSMAAGEYVSMRAQAELQQRELDRERYEIARSPESEQLELAALYRSRGVSADLADQLAIELMADPEIAFATHAREELGVDPDELGDPVRASASSFVSFAVGALIPLLPWFFATGAAASLASVFLATGAALALGATIGALGGRSRVRSALRQAVIAAAAAAVTYLVGLALGTGVVG